MRLPRSSRLAFGAMIAVLTIGGASATWADGRDAFRALEAQAGVGGQIEDLGAELVPVTVYDEAAAKRGVLRPDDVVAFDLTGVAGRRVYVISLDSHGDLTMIYPNEFAPQDEPQGVSALRIPAEDAGYVFRVTGTPGEELVKVVAVTGDAPDFELMLGSLFDLSAPFPPASKSTARVAEELAGYVGGADLGRFEVATLSYVIAK